MARPNEVRPNATVIGTFSQVNETMRTRRHGDHRPLPNLITFLRFGGSALIGSASIAALSAATRRKSMAAGPPLQGSRGDGCRVAKPPGENRGWSLQRV